MAQLQFEASRFCQIGRLVTRLGFVFPLGLHLNDLGQFFLATFHVNICSTFLFCLLYAFLRIIVGKKG